MLCSDSDCQKKRSYGLRNYQKYNLYVIVKECKIYKVDVFSYQKVCVDVLFVDIHIISIFTSHAIGICCSNFSSISNKHKENNNNNTQQITTKFMSQVPLNSKK